MNNLLSVSHLHVSIVENDQPIVVDCSFDIKEGQLHILQGPNGSGKSSLIYALMGHPYYTVSRGKIYFCDNDITNVSIDERARRGMFVALQHPIALPGVSGIDFLRESIAAVTGERLALPVLKERVNNALKAVGLDDSFAHRYVHDNFSGGEKKRFELAQMILLRPKLVILDEIDAGLDVNALERMIAILDTMRKENPSMGILVITHQPRLADLLAPDKVYTMENGRLQ